MASHRSHPAPRSRLLSLLTAAALATAVAAACSPDPSTGGTADGTGAGSAAPGDPGTRDRGNGADGSAPSGPATSSGGGPAATLDELKVRWAEARASVVETLNAPGYGVGDDNVLRGPGGFELDLGPCPSGWSGTEGVEAGTIRIGHTTALTGNLSTSGRVTAGLQAYLDLVNAEGGIDGRRIELIVKDDGFVAATTVEAVNGFLTTDRPFLVTTLGSPTSLAVYDALNAACVPHPFVISSHPAWGDPANHPWTTGLQLAPNTEAALWGAWIEANLAADLPVTVAALVMDNELGHLYRQGFQTWADAHPDVVAAFTPVAHTPTASSVTAEMATVAGAAPEVFLVMTAGRPCILAIQEAAATGLATSARALFTPSLCRDPATYLAPAGAAADGWHVVGGGQKAPTGPGAADDPYLAFVAGALADNGLDPADNLAATGFGLFGWAQVEALRVAAELSGGLTRANLLLALRGLELQHPFLLDGVTFAASGAVDGYYVEGSDVLTFDAGTGDWRQDGPVLDIDGTTPPCPWNGTTCGGP